MQVATLEVKTLGGSHDVSGTGSLVKEALESSFSHSTMGELR